MRTLVGVLCLFLGIAPVSAASSSPAGREVTVPAGPATRGAASTERATGAKAQPIGTRTSATKTRAAKKQTSQATSRSNSSRGPLKTSARKPRAAKPSPVPAGRFAVSQPRPTGYPDGRLRLTSGAALVFDQEREEVLYEKNAGTRLPIASVTKLMTAMVVLDARLSLFEEVQVNEEDVDWLKGSRSRLPLGTSITRHELLYLALVASENRAASALARSYPGGKLAFVAAMNRKAEALGMADTHFEDPTGLFPSNTSTAWDLVRMVRAAHGYPLIRQITTTPFYTLSLPREAGNLDYRNTNRLVRAQSLEIGLSKTGYIQEAGRCLVMQADVAQRPLLIVLLNGGGRATPFEDVTRLQHWLRRRTPDTQATLAHTAG